MISFSTSRRRQRTRNATLIAGFLVVGFIASVCFAPKPLKNREPSKNEPTFKELSKQRSGQPLEETSSSSTQRIAASALGSHLPLSFESNRGQIDRQVKFRSRGRGYELFLTATQAVFSLQHAKREEKDELTQKSRGVKKQAAETFTNLQLTLKNANRRARVSGSDPLPGVANYFIGNNPKG